MKPVAEAIITSTPVMVNASLTSVKLVVELAKHVYEVRYSTALHYLYTIADIIRVIEFYKYSSELKLH
ncbi:MAG: hypothetical protein QW369_01030 [Desulfurococcaceae archaeon]